MLSVVLPVMYMLLQTTYFDWTLISQCDYMLNPLHKLHAVAFRK
jgi:hypothetical protein